MVSDDVLAEQMTAQKHMFVRGVIHPLDRRWVSVQGATAWQKA
jgi:hypothetical protein